ncbi:MAG TPA: NAD(P)H-binding protein [Candidatus Acidoferrales bacterium]|nr:NAD(P)H-binding protein [Candidatus Acidoferrales bacterium]
MYVVTGASGNSGRVVAERLLARGQKVRAIGRSAERLQPLVAKGAEPCVCDLTDREALAAAFAGARGVYVMIPPNVTSKDYRAHQDRITDAVAAALEAAGVEHAVSLSSIGADKKVGVGPVAGQHYLENRLNQIPGLSVVHLRAGYFMENTLAQIGIIKSMGVMAGALRAELEVPMIATQDIGAAAAEALLRLEFTGPSTRELLGHRDISMAEVAGIVGRALGRPHLAYTRLPDDQVRDALTEVGISTNVANLILEMAAGQNTGHMIALEKRSASNTTPTSYETFVKEVFVPQFKGRPAAA